MGSLMLSTPMSQSEDRNLLKKQQHVHQQVVTEKSVPIFLKHTWHLAFAVHAFVHAVTSM